MDAASEIYQVKLTNRKDDPSVRHASLKRHELHLLRAQYAVHEVRQKHVAANNSSIALVTDLTNNDSLTVKTIPPKLDLPNVLVENSVPSAVTVPVVKADPASQIQAPELVSTRQGASIETEQRFIPVSWQLPSTTRDSTLQASDSTADAAEPALSYSENVSTISPGASAGEGGAPAKIPAQSKPNVVAERVATPQPAKSASAGCRVRPNDQSQVLLEKRCSLHAKRQNSFKHRRISNSKISSNEKNKHLYLTSSEAASWHQTSFSAHVNGVRTGSLSFFTSKYEALGSALTDSEVKISLENLLDIFETKMDPQTFETLKNSRSALEFVSLNELKNAGILISFDDKYNVIIRSM
jgi:hypothetical protein